MIYICILFFVSQFAFSQYINGRWFPNGFENTMYDFLNVLKLIE